MTGVAIDGAPTGPEGLAAWDAWTAVVGRRPQLLMWYTSWAADFQAYAVSEAYARGATPIVTWEMTGRRGATISFHDVLAGRWNAYVDRWARAARADGRPIYLRLGHEMNGDWYPWSGARQGANAEAAHRFVRTWRFVHDRFTAVGAHNVVWVWTPNNVSVPNAPWNTPACYYPGDAFVDWVGADGYNFGTSLGDACAVSGPRWQSFDDVFSSVYAQVASLAPAKPFMLGEFASTERGGDKAAWIRRAAERMKVAYPALRAFVWFDYDKETDWRVQSSAASLNAFREAFAEDTAFAWSPR